MTALLQPLLRPGECAVMFDEVATGIVLSKVGLRAISDRDVFHVRPSFEAALAFAEEVVIAHPDWEATVSDEHGMGVATVRSPTWWADFQASSETPRSWWQRLRGRD